MKTNTLILSTLLALSTVTAWSQTNTISSVSIGTAVTAGGTATGVAAVTPLIGTALNQPGSVGNNLAGLQYVAGQIPFTGSPASIAFFALTGAAIPGGAGNPATAVTSYGTLTSPTAVTTYSDAASKLTANSYSGLTWAAANLGFGSGNFYMIHHTNGTDYFAEIVPGTATSTSIADLKPMSWQGPTAGGPASIGTTGYFAISWATGILSAGAPYADQSIYYLRTNSSSHTVFGVMIPALTSASSDTLDLTTAVGAFGAGGYTTLAFSPAAIGPYGANQFYYLRQDSVTGNTILGWLNPSLVAGTRTVSDIANLGGTCNTLGFAPDATGPAGAWGSNQFYVAGAFAAGAQSVSFAAIPNHNVGDVFTITPTASSNLDIDVTVVSGPATVQTTGVSGGTPHSLRVFTITTTGPGIVTLQARQAGRLAAPAFTANELQQSFNVIGAPIITNSPLTAAGNVGTSFTFAIAALGSPTGYTASPLPLGLSVGPTTGIITGTPTTVGTTTVVLGATNSIGTGNATLTITIVAAGVAPIITNNPLTAAGTIGAPFSFTITASGLPALYLSSTLPAGLALNPATGTISGTPTTAATTIVVLSAQNGSGTGSATLTIVVAPAAAAPIITSPVSAPATAGSPFVTYIIAATGVPTSYTATGLPPGLTVNTLTGAINGTPATAGTYVVTITATNAIGTSTATLTIVVAPAAVAPVITSPTTAPAAVGAPFVTYLIAATGLPTSYTATGLPPGLTVNALTGAINGTPTTAGIYAVTITATNAIGTSTATLTIVVAPAAVAPVITSPTTAPAAVGAPFTTYLIAGTGLPTSYTATGLPPGLTVNALTGAINGTPTTGGIYPVAITATNSTGTSTATLTITVAAAPSSRIVNFSARAQAGSGSQTLTLGFVVTGSNKALMVRGDGPALTAFGVANALPDPQLKLYSGSTLIASNTGWGTGGNAVTLVATAGQLGAFQLPSGSADSALITVLSSGAYTAQILGASNDTGTALAEVYDADTNLSARLLNASARMQINVAGGNLNPLIIGFVIGGNAPKTVLIRGVGPGLSAFGVTGVLANPQITLFSSTAQIASNANWSVGNNVAQLSAASNQVGAFPLVSGNLDAAMTATLQPGTYTVQIIGVGNTSGTALLEIYDVQ